MNRTTKILQKAAFLALCLQPAAVMSTMPARSASAELIPAAVMLSKRTHIISHLNVIRETPKLCGSLGYMVFVHLSSVLTCVS